MDREKEKRLWAAFQHCSSSHKQNSRKKYTHTNTYTLRKKKKKISYYPNPCCTLGLCMCFLEYVCVCVWALLCLQDAQRRTGSLKSFGYKVKRARREMETKRREQKRESEREKREEEKKKKRNKTQQHPQREGRLSKVWPTVTLSVWCWQSPLHTHFPGGNRGEVEKVFNLTRMWHLPSRSFISSLPFYKQNLRVQNNSFHDSPPWLRFHSRFMWTRPPAPPCRRLLPSLVSAQLFHLQMYYPSQHHCQVIFFTRSTFFFSF